MIPRLFGEINDKDTQFNVLVKNNQEMILIGGALLVVIIAIIIATSFSNTREGTWRYGLCKVFLERYTEFPKELKILTAAEKQNSAQIGYLLTNSYGSRRSELMECFYNINQSGVTMNRISINRTTYDQKKVDDFNLTIPIILGNEDLNLTLPKRLPNTLIGLKFE